MKRFARSLCVFAFGLLAVVAMPASASATTITFNFEELLTASVTSVSSVQGGLTVTIRRQDNTFFNVTTISGTPPAFGNRTIGNFSSTYGLEATLIMDFSAPVSSASLSFGDFGGDDDATAFFGAFSGAGGTGTNLDLQSVAYPLALDLSNGNSAIRTLTVNGAGIRSLTFIAGGPFPGSLYVDNLIVETAPAAVPEPTSMVLLGTGVAALVARRLRRT